LDLEKNNLVLDDYKNGFLWLGTFYEENLSRKDPGLIFTNFSY
jgi:hypothetical protein